MTDADLLGLVGSVALFAFAFLLAWIARRSHRFNRYGQEALACAAAWVFVVAITRCLSIADVIGTTLVRSANTLAAIVFLTILAELVWLRRVETTNGRRRGDRPEVRPEDALRSPSAR